MSLTNLYLKHPACNGLHSGFLDDTDVLCKGAFQVGKCPASILTAGDPSAVNGGRINIGACSLGGAAFCLEAAQAHAAVREQFGQAIGSFQAIQFKLADMATSLHSARLMVR